MLSLVRRELTLYFGSPSNVFMSLLGALISFVLYLVFLQHNLAQSFTHVVNGQAVLDFWLLSGTIAVAGITTTFTGMSLFVRDLESGTIADFLVSGVSKVRIRLSYLISTYIIGVLMQLIVFIVIFGYFASVDKITLSLTQMGQTVGLIIFTSVLWVMLNALLTFPVNSSDTLGRMGSIIGTAAGFFATVYIPVGTLSRGAQNVIGLTPAPYVSTLFRQVLIPQSSLPSDVKDLLGLTFTINRVTLESSNVLLLIVAVFLLVYTAFLGVAVLRRRDSNMI
ncbi:ABC transporter permease [Weissella sp. GP1]|uniref:ABC transporter permease n=1 Tax=Weissella confusa TaxID=1583 RepID=UPI0032DAF682